MTSMCAFTCMTCRVSFTSADSQRDHYKLEWHSYNLKRKLAQMPPISYEQFQRIQELHQQNKNLGHNQTIDQNKESFYCKTCRKQFNNDKAYEQHINSKKHQNMVETQEVRAAIAVKKSENAKNKSRNNSINEEKCVVEEEKDKNDSDWESVDSDDDEDCGENEEPILPNTCLFCEHSSDSLENNMTHMSEKHSFFVPDLEYLIDLEGLIRYLGEKVGSGHCCLWCGDTGKHFHSKKSTQQHMTDKGHSKMRYEQSGDALLEYSDYFDYSTSYPDSDPNEVNNDEEISIANIDDEDWQLSLPSGAVIGHRSLFRYYKQNLKPITDSIRNHSKSAAILGKVMSQYRSLGWTGITGETAVLKAKDIKFMQKIQKRHELKIGQKNNTILQKHFRSQIGF